MKTTYRQRLKTWWKNLWLTEDEPIDEYDWDDLDSNETMYPEQFAKPSGWLRTLPAKMDQERLSNEDWQTPNQTETQLLKTR